VAIIHPFCESIIFLIDILNFGRWFYHITNLISMFYDPYEYIHITFVQYNPRRDSREKHRKHVQWRNRVRWKVTYEKR